MPAQCHVHQVSRSEWDELLSRYTYALYYASWWLDVASSGSVRYLVARYQETPVAIMAYVYRHREVVMPPYCQYTGVHYLTDELTLGQRQQVEQALLTSLPKHSFLHLHYAPSALDFMGAYWLGYKQSLRYNYVLDLRALSAPSEFVSSITKSLRRNYRASARLQLVYDGYVPMEELLALLSSSAQVKGYKAHLNILARLIQTAREQARVRLIGLREPSGQQLVIGALWVEHQRRAYLIAEGTDRVLASRYQLKTLLLEWYITEVFDSIDMIDFEGSMLKPIAQIYQGYQALREPYHSITRGQRSWLSRIQRLCHKM